MNRRIGWLVLVLTVALLLTASGPASAITDRSPGGSRIEERPPMASGVVLVGLEPGVTLSSEKVGAQSGDAALSGVLDLVGVRSVERLVATGQGAVKAVSSEDESALDRIYRLHVPPEADISQAVETLQRCPGVAYAEPDYLAHIIAAPDDPYYGEQWGLTQIGASSAWDGTTGTAEVVVAVVDSGLDMDHPDLASQLWTNPGETGGNGADDDNNGHVDDVHGWNVVGDDANLSDSTGHGTQVAGVIGAETDNGEGVAGTCWNCRLMVVKVTQSGGVANYSDIAAGVAYAAGKGAEVINLSLGGYADSVTLRTAIQEAAKTAVVVGGAGNDDSAEPFYPAAYDEVLAVAGTDTGDAKVSNSNYGSWVDVSGPGEAIKTTFDGGTYGDASGTSMAAGFVSGVVGLLRSQNSDWTPELVKAHIVQTSDAIDAINPGYEGQLGSGRLDAAAAVGTDASPDLSVQGYAVNGKDGNPEPGSSFELAVTLVNDWAPARGLEGVLSTSDAYATVDDADGSFGDIASGAEGDNSGDPFRITLAQNTPYAHEIPLSLDLGDDAGFSESLSFVVTVRSGFEHLPGGTVLTTDTTWTADKTYVLDGDVVLDEGTQLTIEPGTTVKAAAGVWLRVDGTLVASGTADLPISFIGATETTTGTVSWAGLRFTDRSESAALDENRSYVSGSIVSHATLSDADAAIGVNGGAPYVAHSLFDDNGDGISVQNQGEVTVVDCEFMGSNNGITANDSRLSVMHSTFTDNTTAIHADNTSMTLVRNTMRDNATGIQGYGWDNTSVEARENVIVDNAGRGASLAGQVVFQNNLVANNGGRGVNLEINSTGTDQYNPAVAFNTEEAEYLVAWQEHRSESNDIIAARVSSNGTIVEAEIGVATTISDERQVDVVYNPTQDQYLAVYDRNDDEATPDGSDVYGRILSGSGYPVGDPFLISGAQKMQVAPRAVYIDSSNNYLVVWRDYRNGSSYRLYGRLLDSDGVLLTEEVLMTSTEVHNGPALAWDPAGGKALVAWDGVSNDPDWWEGILGQSLTISGSQIITDTPFLIKEWWDWGTPTVAYDDSRQRFLVAWNESQRIHTSLVPQTISSTVAVSTSKQLYDPNLVYQPATDQFLLTWRSGDMTSDIHARYLDHRGSPAGEVFLVSGADENQASPTAVGNVPDGESLVVWQDRRSEAYRIYGQRLGLDGRLLDNPDTRVKETDPTVNFRIASDRGVRYNTIIHNGGRGMEVRGQQADSISFGANNLFGNDTYDLYLATSTDINASENYWGATPLSQVPVRIYDCNDKEFGCPDEQVGAVTYEPAATSPITEAPAFAQEVTASPQTAGIERVTFDVTFSRAMEQGVLPEISFHLSKRGTNTIFAEEDGLADGDVSVVEADREGHLWVGSSRWEGGGVSRYDGQQWTSYTTSNSGLLANAIYDILAAADGAIWFGHEEGVSRWDGDRWVTYTNSSGVSIDSISAIAETSEGTVWFARHGGLLSYDGTTWKEYTTDGGVPGHSVEDLAVDEQDRIWIVFMDSQSGVAMYDGSYWTTYDASDGFDAEWVRTIFADSAGRVWATTSSSTADTCLSKFQEGEWTTYGSQNTDGTLGYEVSAIAEDDEGVVWFASGGDSKLVKYHSGIWSSQEITQTSDEIRTMAFDGQGNLWTNWSYDGGVRVLWLGDDYPVMENGQWLDDDHYRATYDVTSLVPRGDYDVAVSGARSASTVMSGTETIALPAGGMQIPAETQFGFTVDYAGEISDRTAPEAPSVMAAGKEGDPTTVEARWWAEEPESQITGYRYAIGSAAEATDIVNWTTTAGTSLTRSGLGLIEGQQYWLSVQAKNAGGLWSSSGYSAFTAGQGLSQVFLPLALRRR